MNQWWNSGGTKTQRRSARQWIREMSISKMSWSSCASTMELGRWRRGEDEWESGRVGELIGSSETKQKDYVACWPSNRDHNTWELDQTIKVQYGVLRMHAPLRSTYVRSINYMDLTSIFVSLQEELFWWNHWWLTEWTDRFFLSFLCYICYGWEDPAWKISKVPIQTLSQYLSHGLDHNPVPLSTGHHPTYKLVYEMRPWVDHEVFWWVVFVFQVYLFIFYSVRYALVDGALHCIAFIALLYPRRVMPEPATRHQVSRWDR